MRVGKLTISISEKCRKARQTNEKTWQNGMPHRRERERENCDAIEHTISFGSYVCARTSASAPRLQRIEKENGKNSCAIVTRVLTSDTGHKRMLHATGAKTNFESIIRLFFKRFTSATHTQYESTNIIGWKTLHELKLTYFLRSTLVHVIDDKRCD